MYYLTLDERILINEGPTCVLLYSCFTFLFVCYLRCFFIQVWNLANCKLKTNHIGHTGFLNTVTVSPDGSLCASGGKV